MTSPYKRPESVLVLVYTREGQVLLLQRQQPGDFWQSVTGSMRWDETDPLQTAIRELREETGLDGQAIVDCHKSNSFPILPQWRHRYAPEVSENREHVFKLELAECRDITLNPGEHRSYAWLSKDEAIAKASSWTNSEAIRDLI